MIIMGHNVDLQTLMGLPEKIKCDECNNMVDSFFDDYDIDCGKPNAKDGIMTLDVQCSVCEKEIEYPVEIIKRSDYQ